MLWNCHAYILIILIWIWCKMSDLNIPMWISIYLGTIYMLCMGKQDGKDSLTAKQDWVSGLKRWIFIIERMYNKRVEYQLRDSSNQAPPAKLKTAAWGLSSWFKPSFYKKSIQGRKKSTNAHPNPTKWWLITELTRSKITDKISFVPQYWAEWKWKLNYLGHWILPVLKLSILELQYLINLTGDCQHFWGNQAWKSFTQL